MSQRAEAERRRIRTDGRTDGNRETQTRTRQSETANATGQERTFEFVRRE